MTDTPSNVIALADKRPKMPEQRETMCEIIFHDNGDTTVWVADYIQTVEQFNWLFAKLAASGGALHRHKVRVTGHE